MGAGKIDKDLVCKVIYGNLENNSHIRSGQYLFSLYCNTVVLYGEITEQLVYGKDIRKMRDLTTDVMRNPTFT